MGAFHVTPSARSERRRVAQKARSAQRLALDGKSLQTPGGASQSWGCCLYRDCVCVCSGPAVYDLTPCHCPTRLLRPWDCPGKNTAVGCHSLLPGGLLNPCVKSMLVIYKLSVSGALFIYVKKSIKVKAAQTCLTLQPHGLQSMEPSRPEC